MGELQDYSIKDILAEVEVYRPAETYYTEDIYALLEPDGCLEDKESIRYVGKSNNPQRRLKAHLSESSRKNRTKDFWIRRLKAQGKRPKLVILWSCHRNYVIEIEDAWTRLFMNLGCPLLNPLIPPTTAKTTIKTIYETNGEEPPEDCVEIFKQFIQFAGICEREGVSIRKMASHKPGGAS